MRLAYQYKIKPTSEQKLKLNYVRRVGQYVYNRALGERMDWWEKNRCPINACPLICHLPELKDNPTYLSQQNVLPDLKKDLVFVKWSGELLDLTDLYSHVLQDVVRRVDLAMQRYVLGDKNGNRSGQPRFKSESRYKSFTYQEGRGEAFVFRYISFATRLKHKCFAPTSWIKGRNIRLPKIGDVRVIWHRPLPQGFKLKTCIVGQKSDGWHITLTLEEQTVPEFTPDSIQPNWENSLGLDAVLHEDVFLATSDKELLPALKAYRTSESKLKSVAAKKSGKRKGSRARRKLAKKEARIHQRIARSRKDHHYKTAHSLVKLQKKVFFVEDLELKNLTKRNQAKISEDGCFLPNNQSSKSGLNKSFLDAGFGQFVEILSHIVAKTGGRVVGVKPDYTSQICCECEPKVALLALEYVPKGLGDRIHSCPACGLVIDRDILAAINTKRVGVDVFPTIKRRRGKLVVTSTNSTSKEFLIGSPTHNL